VRHLTKSNKYDRVQSGLTTREEGERDEGKNPGWPWLIGGSSCCSWAGCAAWPVQRGNLAVHARHRIGNGDDVFAGAGSVQVLSGGEGFRGGSPSVRRCPSSVRNSVCGAAHHDGNCGELAASNVEPRGAPSGLLFFGITKREWPPEVQAATVFCLRYIRANPVAQLRSAEAESPRQKAG